VARSFAGDPKQVKELIKAALNHNGVAVLDIISPCVTFNNTDQATHSYAWGKNHEEALHELSYVPRAEEILMEYEEGESREVELHDGSVIVLRKLERDYDPTDREAAIRVLEEANKSRCLITGLIYIDPNQPSMWELYQLTDQPLNRLREDQLRPPKETLADLNRMFQA
jgi:2-oxoglutarate ferredoxin oxidoreductase subunit beta